MDGLDLIKQIHNPKTNELTPLPKGLPYKLHVVMVEGEETRILIPLCESERFGSIVANKEMSRHNFNMIVREHRGIRG